MHLFERFCDVGLRWQLAPCALHVLRFRCIFKRKKSDWRRRQKPLEASFVAERWMIGLRSRVEIRYLQARPTRSCVTAWREQVASLVEEKLLISTRERRRSVDRTRIDQFLFVTPAESQDEWWNAIFTGEETNVRQFIFRRLQYVIALDSITGSTHRHNSTVLTTTIRLRFDGRSTAYQGSLRSQWRNTSPAADPLAPVTLIC